MLARFSLPLVGWLLLACGAIAADGPEAAREGQDYFERHIRPVLVEQCYACHSSQAEEIQAGLVLDSRDGWQRGSESGPVIVPGEPEQSPLLKAIRYDADSAAMPPEQKLGDDVVDHFAQWIRMGAPDPRVESSAHSTEPSPAPRTG